MFSTLGWVVLVYPYFGRQGGQLGPQPATIIKKQYVD